MPSPRLRCRVNASPTTNCLPISWRLHWYERATSASLADGLPAGLNHAVGKPITREGLRVAMARALAHVNSDYVIPPDGPTLAELACRVRGKPGDMIEVAQASEQVQLRFELVSPRLRVETMGRVAWADSGG